MEKERERAERARSMAAPGEARREVAQTLTTKDLFNESINMGEDLADGFQNQDSFEAPPKADSRSFNVHDIYGDLDRDDKGNVIVGADAQGKTRDKQGNPINQRGYLTNRETGAIIDNVAHRQMFSPSELDERGELPAPFSLEKYNFNPHLMMGDFDYTGAKPNLLQSAQGFFLDKRSRRVNKFGWMTQAGHGHLVDVTGRKKFDKSLLTREGDLPKLFTYQKVRFDIKDVMGIFEKDSQGRIVPTQSQRGGGGLVDTTGRKVNEKGYLVDASGNVIDCNGKLLWRVEHLKNGEFPKIFPFSKFNVQRVRGDLDFDARGHPLSTTSGKDCQGRPVNKCGYLVDASGNVIDSRSRLMFEKVVLTADGELPPVFLNNVLPCETGEEEISVLDEGGAFNQRQEGETSLDSKMEDTPANYTDANHRYGGGGQTLNPADGGEQVMGMLSEEENEDDDDHDNDDVP